MTEPRKQPDQITDPRVVAYAVNLVADGAAEVAEEDMDEDGELDGGGEHDLDDAITLACDMAHAIKDHHQSFMAWYRTVRTPGE